MVRIYRHFVTYFEHFAFVGMAAIFGAFYFLRRQNGNSLYEDKNKWFLIFLLLPGYLEY